MIRSLCARLRDEQGFSLVELLVVMLVMAIIGGIVATSLVSGWRSSETAEERIDALLETQQAMQRMSREIRASYAHDVTGGALVVAEADRLVADVFRDGDRLRFHWWTEDSGEDLVTICHAREDIDPAAPPAAPDETPDCEQQALSDLTPDTPLFQYFATDEEDCLAGCGEATVVDDEDLPRVEAVELTVRRPVRSRQAPDDIEVATRLTLRNACISSQVTSCEEPTP